MTQYQFDPVYVESFQPFNSEYLRNYLIGTFAGLTAGQDPGASSLPTSTDDVSLNGSDIDCSSDDWNSVSNGLLDAGNLTVGTALGLGVSEAGRSFLLANGQGGQQQFVPTAGAATLTAQMAQDCGVGTDGTIDAVDADTCTVSGGTLNATDITNTFNSYPSYGITVESFGRSYGAISGYTDGGTVTATNIINDGNTSGALIAMDGDGDGISGTITAQNVYSTGSVGMGNFISGADQKLIVDNYDTNSDTPAGLTDTLTIEDGGVVEVDDSMGIGRQAGDKSTISISGAGSELIASTISLDIGVAGTGIVNVTDGGEVQGEAAAIGGQPPAGSTDTNPSDFGTGTVTIDGSGSTFETSSLTVGGFMPTATNGSGDPDGDGGVWTYTGGVGTLTVSNGGTVMVDGTLTLQGEVDVAADGTETAVGGIDVDTGGNIDIGEGGTPAAPVPGGSAPPPAPLPVPAITLGPNNSLVGHGGIGVGDAANVTGSKPIGNSQQIPTYALQIKDFGGMIEAKNGLLVIDGDVVGNAVAQIDDNSTLELGGSFSSGSMIKFNDSDPNTGTGTLILDDPQDFQGSIQAIAVGDSIVLKNTNFENGNGIVSATIGDNSDGVQTLQIVEGTDALNVTDIINIPIEGEPGADSPGGPGDLSGDYISIQQMPMSTTANNSTVASASAVLTLQRQQQVPAVLGWPQPSQSEGSGLKIGIISGSFNLNGLAFLDQLVGKLSSYDILREGPAKTGSTTDEGRAMAQIIHQLVPGAEILFYSASGASGQPTNANTAAAIQALTASGCKVIVDDVPGVLVGSPAVDAAIAAATAAGVSYVTSAGNNREVGIPISGIAANPLAETVAAMNVRATPYRGILPPMTEPFSSIGTPGSGKPDITGLDGVTTTFPLSLQPLDGLNPFFGTSAAAPDVAGVIGQMLIANPQLALPGFSALVKSILAVSATPLGSPETPQTSGAGLVNQPGAVSLAAALAEPFFTGTDPPGPTLTSALLSDPPGYDADAGSTVQLVLTINEAVTVAGGTPAFSLSDGAVATYDANASDPGSGQLVFDYAVGTSDSSTNLAVTGYNSNGATIEDTNGDSPDLSGLFNVPTGVTINSPLRVASVASEQTGEVQAGQTVQLVVTMNEAVTVNAAGGAPTLNLSNGATATYDASESNPSADRLVFDYTVGGDDSISNLGVISAYLPAGTTVQDAGGNNADFSDAQDQSTGLQIGPAFVSSFFAQTSAAHTGQTVQLTLMMSEGVTVNTTAGSPALSLNDGATAAYDGDASDPAAGLLVFDYTVGSADQTSDLVVTAFNPNGASIPDANGVAADFSAVLNVPIGLTINSPLQATSVAPSGTGAVLAGQTVQLTVALNEAVQDNSVDNTDPPMLTLNDGGTAYYDAAASNLPAGDLVFDYTPAAGELTQNLEITSVTLNGEDIVDANGNLPDFSAVLDVPTNVQVGSLADLTTTAYMGSYEAVWSPATGILDIVDTADANAVVATLNYSGALLSDALVTLGSDGATGTLVGLAPFAFVTVNPGDIVVSGITGQAFSAYEQLYDNGVYAGLDYFFTNVSGQAYSAYEYDYSSGNNFIGSKFYYTDVAGEPYSAYEYDYDGGGNVTHVAFTGVSGAPYSSYAYDYVGGVFAGSQFTFTSVPAGASYTSYETDYDEDNNFIGDKFSFNGIQGQSYTTEEEDFDAAGQLAKVLLSGFSNVPYSSLELDYSGGSYAGYKAFYTPTGQPYTSEEVDVSATNMLSKVIYSGLASALYPYSSLEEDFTNGALSGEVYGFTNVTGQSYYAYQVKEDGGGNAQQEILDNNDGSHTIIGLQADQTLTSIGDDTMTGGGVSETFMFNPIYGHDTITDFASHLTGMGQDTISLPTSEFANFAAVLAATQTVGSNAVITAPNGDTITLDNITAGMLQASQGNFVFHA